MQSGRNGMRIFISIFSEFMYYVIEMLSPFTLEKLVKRNLQSCLKKLHYNYMLIAKSVRMRNRSAPDWSSRKQTLWHCSAATFFYFLTVFLFFMFLFFFLTRIKNVQSTLFSILIFLLNWKIYILFKCKIYC